VWGLNDMAYDDIPQELKQYPNWICWRYEERDGKPTKIPYDPKTGFPAKVDDFRTWVSFEHALSTYSTVNGYSGLGFVLSDTDPFAFIDLDKTTDAATLQRQIKIFEAFDSYAERSPSGFGCHIIFKAHVPQGRRRGNIELYSSHRYMTVTGDVIAAKPIAERQSLANTLWHEMGKDINGHAITIDEPQTLDDNTLILKAMEESAKFAALFMGEWQGVYQSQSEADFALIDMLVFHTKNREQIARVFRMSALGQRTKALRNDYVNTMVVRSFDRYMPPIDFSNLKASFSRINETTPNVADLWSTTPGPSAMGGAVQQRGTGVGPEPHSVTTLVAGSSPAVNPYTLPPGLMGEIADFIYKAAPLPVPEIALAGAIGLMSGLCGRAFNTYSGAGLNLYTLLVAESGRGKEAMASGISKLINSAATLIPNRPGAVATASIREFLGPGEIRSDAALLRELNSRSCFVSVIGEFGLKLQAMTAQNASGYLVGLRSVLLDLYGKSGAGNVLRPMVYSDKDKNTKILNSPAFSILAETTPGTFYEGLTEGMISQGLLPRFLIIEYYGERPPLSETFHLVQPSSKLANDIAALGVQCHDLMAKGQILTPTFTDDAKKLERIYGEYARTAINKPENKSMAELWNRAHLITLKVASLIAIGINPHSPTIDAPIWEWAERLTTSSIRNISSRFEHGEVGKDDTTSKQETQAMRICNEYVNSDFNNVSNYVKQMGSFAANLHKQRIVPYLYINKRLSVISVFKNDRFGTTQAINKTLQALKDNGELFECTEQFLHTQGAPKAAKGTLRAFKVG